MRLRRSTVRDTIVSHLRHTFARTCPRRFAARQTPERRAVPPSNDVPTHPVERTSSCRAAPRARNGRLWRSLVRGVLVAAGGACLLEAAYWVFAFALLPRYFEDAARRGGLELTFSALQSWYPGLRIRPPIRSNRNLPRTSR